MTCAFCQSEAVTSVEFECGNNAEYCIYVNLCEAHNEEQEKTGYEFQEKYGSEIEQLHSERWA